MEADRQAGGGTGRKGGGKMNGLPYYPKYPRDFLDGTVGMSLEVKGAYSVVLDLIYMMGDRGLPDDPKFISGHLGCSVRKWNSIKKELVERGKIELENGIISNFRADKEKIIQRKFQDKQSENRSRPNKNKDLESPRSHHTDTHTDTKVVDKSTTGVGLKPKPPAGAKADRLSENVLSAVVSADVARDFVTHRRQMKKPLTELAAKRMAAKLERHHSPDAVLNHSIENGWQGIFPEKVGATKSGPATNDDFLARVL